MKISDNELIRLAKEARARSYCPYSNIAVGAALLTRGGKIYTGANIESASFTPTVCAERVALSTAVHAGEREFVAIAIVGGKKDEEATKLFTPCGVCRQMLAEFADGDLRVIVATENETLTLTLAELLPHGFGKEQM